MSAERIPELDADARALIRSTSEVYEPSALQRARVLGSLDGKLAASTAFWSKTKAVTAVVLLGFVAVAGWYARGRAAGSAAPAISLQPQPSAQLASASMVPPAAPAPEVQPAPVASSAVASSSQALTKASRPSAPAVSNSAPAVSNSAPAVSNSAPAVSNSTSAPAVSRSTLAEEVAVLGSAQRALDRGQNAQALALLREYDVRFESGMLQEERRAAEVFALCRSGDAAGARIAGQRFLARFPKSPLTPRVQSSCVAGLTPRD